MDVAKAINRAQIHLRDHWYNAIGHWRMNSSPGQNHMNTLVGPHSVDCVVVPRA